MANFTGTALFVVADAGTLNFADTQMKDRLELNGWTVTLKSDEDAFLDTDSNWETFDVAVVSESISSSTLGTSGRDAVVGVVFLEPGGVDDWNLAVTAGNSGAATALNMIANHETGAGLAAGGGNDFELDVVTTSKQMAILDDESSGAVTVSGRGSGGVDLFTGYWVLGATLTTGTAAERRVYDAMWKISTSAPDETVSPGFVNTDLSWAIFDAEVEWAAGNDITTDRQLGVPDNDLVTTDWTKTDATNFFADVDDGAIPDSATTMVTSPSNPIASPISFDLATLTDPTNNNFHTVAVAFRRETGSRVATLTAELRQGYVNESTLGTEIATSGAVSVDSVTHWGGLILQLTDTEEDNITDYADLQIRLVANTSGGGATTRIQVTSIRLLIDGGAAGPQTIAVGTATESESARVIGSRKTVAVGTALEAEAGQPVGARKIVAVGGTIEAEVAQPIVPVKPIIVLVGTAAEVEAAQAVAARKAAAVGTAFEVELAQVIVPLKPIIEPVGTAFESEAAQVITVIIGGAQNIAVGTAFENEAARVVGVVKIVIVGTATETEVAQAVAALKQIAVGTAVEAEAAQPIAAVKPIIVSVGTATEAEVAQAVAVLKRVVVGTATESELAQPVAVLKPIIQAVGTAFEAEVAQVITVVGGVAFFWAQDPVTFAQAPVAYTPLLPGQPNPLV